MLIKPLQKFYKATIQWVRIKKRDLSSGRKDNFFWVGQNQYSLN